MSTKEMVLQCIDSLDEEQLEQALQLLQQLKTETLPADTLAAIQEVEDMKNNPEQYPGYTDMESLMKDMLL